MASCGLKSCGTSPLRNHGDTPTVERRRGCQVSAVVVSEGPEAAMKKKATAEGFKMSEILFAVSCSSVFGICWIEAC